MIRARFALRFKSLLIAYGYFAGSRANPSGLFDLDGGEKHVRSPNWESRRFGLRELSELVCQVDMPQRLVGLFE